MHLISKLFIISILIITQLPTYSQDNSESSPDTSSSLIGLSEIRFHNRTLKFDNIKQLGSGNNLLGVTISGIKSNFLSMDRILPVSFDVIFKENGNLDLHEYQIALLGSGFASQVNNYFTHKASLELFQFDREHLNEGLSHSLQVDRFKFINVQYSGFFNVAPGVLKLTFSAQIAPLQGTRSALASKELNDYLKQITHNPNYKFGNPDKASTFDKTLGRMEIYHHHQIQNKLNQDGIFKTNVRLFEGFLGDSEFSVGLELFNFISAKASIGFDGTQTVSRDKMTNTTYYIEFSGTKKGLEVEADFGKRFPKSTGIRRFVVFAKMYNESNALITEEETTQGVNIVVDDSYHVTTGIIGVRYRFGKWKK